MKGEAYLKKPADFDRIHNQGRYLGGQAISVKSLPNSLPYSRWAIITGKKIGTAVVRNRVKRRLREILRQINIKPGEDIIILTRMTAATADYRKLQEETLSLLKKADLVKINETDSPVAD